MEAILLLGHGSRAVGASEPMERLGEMLQRRHPDRAVRVCHMELAEPTLEETLERCALDGIRNVAVLPYFLHLGMHLREDIPAILETVRRRHPSLRVRLCPPLGFHEALLGILEQRLPETLWQTP